MTPQDQQGRQNQQKRPNILIIMADDLGPWALGATGNGEVRSPNIDRLAAEGTRFSNFFCTSPVCSPARASFLTGRIPSQHGVHDWLRSGNIEVEDGVTWCGKDRPIEYLRGLPGFTSVLAENGYLCALSGKWHLGDSARPQQGHSWWYAHSLGGASYVNYYAFDNSPQLVHKTQYVTDYYTDRAIEFLDAHGRGEKPFCLSLHYTAPHSPWGRDEHPAELYDSYASCPFDSIPVEPPHPWGGWKATPQQRRATQQGYFAAITGMDIGIGRVMRKLDELRLRDSTLVVFLSDNGMNIGQHGILGKGNGTFPLNMYDTSVKVPFIVSCPGRVPAGVVHDGLHSQYDFMPTLLDYLGMPNTQAAGLPGRSFAPVLRGGSGDVQDNIVVFDEYGPVRMIRDRQWKYVHRNPDGPHELYDLQHDGDERRNLIDDRGHAAVAAEMRGRMEAWFRQYVDPRRDGANLKVSGSGQIDMVGPEGGGRTAFM